MNALILFDAPSWIQAGAAIVGALLTLLTLIVLLRYADDTKKIAEASASPEEREMPFLTVTWTERSADQPAPRWIITNQGNGPALDVRFRTYSTDGEEHWRPIAGFGKGQKRAAFDKHIRQHIQDVPSRNRPFVIQYKSLSGLAYSTVIERLSNDEKDLITHFQRPNIAPSSDTFLDVIKRVWR